MRPPATFPHPLPAEALTLFCHPDPAHNLSRPIYDRISRNTFAGNGHLALMMTNGAWDHAQHSESITALQRFSKLPWSQLADVATIAAKAHLWKPLDDIRNKLHTRSILSIFTGHRLSPSPIILLNNQGDRITLSTWNKSLRDLICGNEVVEEVKIND
jgi:hypothetical protein